MGEKNKILERLLEFQFDKILDGSIIGIGSLNCFNFIGFRL